MNPDAELAVETVDGQKTERNRCYRLSGVGVAWQHTQTMAAYDDGAIKRSDDHYYYFLTSVSP